MWRLIGLLLLTLAPLATMAQTNYPIHEDFRAACRITAPLGHGALGIGNAFLAAMPKGMRSNSEITIDKIEITSTVDGKEFGAWVITPKEVAAPRPAILFLHGGGFVFKGAPYHYDLAKEYARRTGSVVVKDIPSNVGAMGNPCRVVRPITDSDNLKSWDRAPYGH